MGIMLISSKNKNPMIYYDKKQLKLCQIQKMGGYFQWKCMKHVILMKKKG